MFDDLGFSHSEASALKIKAALLDAILREVQDRAYTQSELVGILDEYQPAVRNLMRGKIAKVSLEKLLTYTDRLRMQTRLTVIRTSRAANHPNHRSRLTRNRAVIAAG